MKNKLTTILLTKDFAKIASLKKLMLTAGFMLAAVFAANAATYTVSKTADTNDGACDADCSLREAITASNANPADDTIVFAPEANGTITLSSSLPSLINNGTLSITGNSPANTIISGNNAFRPIEVNSGASVTLNRLTVTQGFTGSASNGGAGIRVNGGAMVTVADSIVSNNVTEATGGGGGIISLGSLTIVRSSISGNTASNARGGGIRSLGTLTISDSLINGNNANGTSALATEDSTAVLTNTTVSGNGLTRAAESILNVSISRAANLMLNNCTVTSNNGTGILTTRNTTGSTATTVLENSIIANNSNQQLTIGGQNTTYISQGYNLTSDNGSGFLTAIGDQINTDPLLAPLADNGGQTLTHALLWGSPAVDAGNSTLMTDQRGFARPVDIPSYPNAANGSDIGAFESQQLVLNKDQCKNNGWMTFTYPRTFNNLGDCIQFVNTGK